MRLLERMVAVSERFEVSDKLSKVFFADISFRGRSLASTE